MLPDVCVAADMETDGTAAVAELNWGAAGAVASADSDDVDEAGFFPRKLNLGQNCDELIVEQPTSEDNMTTTAPCASETRIRCVLVTGVSPPTAVPQDACVFPPGFGRSTWGGCGG